jgi:DNA-binding SARP family transcriptional activator
MLEIYLLGSFQLVHEQETITEAAWHTKQARQLLKILLTRRGKIVPRDQLIEALWPEADPSKAATTLRTAINALRNTLEPGRPPYAPSTYIVAHAPGYKFQFTDAVWVDAMAFETLLDQAAAAPDPEQQQVLLTQAISLYRDDYLGDDLYVDWAYLERERLRERYLNALTQLAECQANQGDYERAIASLRRVLTRDPGREPVYRTLMRYYILAGNTVAALKSFEQLRGYLQDELNVEPSPQTVTLYQSILNGQFAWQSNAPLIIPETQSPLETIFVGREAEIKRLSQYLIETVHGRGHLVALTGEVGVGKTRLATVLLAQAAEQGVISLTTRCQAIEQALPFAPIVEALETLAAHHPDISFDQLAEADKRQLAQLLPSLAWQVELTEGEPGLPEDNRRLLVHSLVKALHHLAQNGLVLFLDDLQWGDEATLALLAKLTRTLPQSKLLVLIAYRPEEVGQNSSLTALLHDLTRHRLLQEISLTRFSAREVKWYLQKIVPQTDISRPAAQAVIRRLHKLTGGNPLFLTETLRALLDERPDALTAANFGRLLDDPTLERPSPQVADIILARLGQLSLEARDILDIVAVIGRDFSVDFLDTVATSDPLPALTFLLQRQFLVETASGRLDFSHHLVREVIYRRLSPLAKQRLHQRVAQVLITLHGSQAGPKAAEITRHSQLAGTRYGLQTVKFAVLAGDYAMRTFGFQEAILHYRQALTLGLGLSPRPPLDDWLRQAYHGLGMAQESLADWDAARETYNELQHWAQQRGNTALVLVAKQRLATMLGLIGQLEESAAISARISEQLLPNTPLPLVEMQNRLGLLLSSREELQFEPEPDWPNFQPQPVSTLQPWAKISQILGERQAIQPLNLYGWALTLQGQTGVAEATLHYAAEIAASYNQPGLQATSYHLLAQLWDSRGDYTQMEDALAQALALVENVSYLRWAVIWGRIHRAYVDMRWNQLARSRRRLDELGQELENRSAFRSHWLSVQVGLGLLAVFQHHLVEASRYFEQVLANPKDLYASNYVVLHLSRARLNRYQGDLAAAQKDISRALVFAGKRGMLADYISAVVEASRFDRTNGCPLQTVPLLEEVEGRASQAGLLPARLSLQQALFRAYAQANQLEKADWYHRLARVDRDTIAATIPHPEDRAAYLERHDLRALD